MKKYKVIKSFAHRFPERDWVHFKADTFISVDEVDYIKSQNSDNVKLNNIELVELDVVKVLRGFKVKDVLESELNDYLDDKWVEFDKAVASMKDKLDVSKGSNRLSIYTAGLGNKKPIKKVEIVTTEELKDELFNKDQELTLDYLTAYNGIGDTTAQKLIDYAKTVQGLKDKLINNYDEMIDMFNDKVVINLKRYLIK